MKKIGLVALICAALLVGVAQPSWAEGEGEVILYHSADTYYDGQISLSELLRVIQFYNSFQYHCEDGTEDGYGLAGGDQSCAPHDSDYNPQDWRISLSELLRLIQLYNSVHYHPCEDGEDGFCPRQAVGEVITPFNVLGDELSVGKGRLMGQGFRTKLVWDYHSTIPAGFVSDYFPKEAVPPNSEITLVVSAGPAPVVPIITQGLSFEEVKAILEGVGFEVEEAPTEEFSDIVAEGGFVKTLPPSGTTITYGQKVKVVISLGPEPEGEGSAEGEGEGEGQPEGNTEGESEGGTEGEGEGGGEGETPFEFTFESERTLTSGVLEVVLGGFDSLYGIGTNGSKPYYETYIFPDASGIAVRVNTDNTVTILNRVGASVAADPVLVNGKVKILKDWVSQTTGIQTINAFGRDATMPTDGSADIERTIQVRVR